MITRCEWSVGNMRCVIDWRAVRKNWTDNLWRWTVAILNDNGEVIACDGNVVATRDEAYEACLNWIKGKGHDR